VPRFGRRQPREPGSDARASPRSDAATEEALGVARSDLAAIADEVGVADVDVQSPGAPPAAGDRYDQALRSFMLAGEQLERAQRPADLVAVGEALEHARFELACIRAMLDGATSPARTAPCVFDPRHGPSVAEVPWSPSRTGVAAGPGPGAGSGAGTGSGPGDRDDVRSVPVCAADAQRLADGAVPDVRLVSVGDRSKPYWEVPVLYGPLLVGYYQRFGGAQRLTALLRGTPLGDALAGNR
jgi:hypothetical protein